MGKTKAKGIEIKEELVEEMIRYREKVIAALQKLLFDLKWDPHPHISKSAEKSIEEGGEENKNRFCPYCGKRLAIEDLPLRKLDGDLSGLLNPDKPPRNVKTIDKMNASVHRAIREDPEGFKNGFRDLDGTNSLEALKRKNHYRFYGLKADNPDKPCRAMREGTNLCGDLPGMAPEGKCYFDHQKDCNAWCTQWEGDEEDEEVKKIREIQDKIRNCGLPKYKVDQ